MAEQMNGHVIDRKMLAERILLGRRRENISQAEIVRDLKETGITPIFISNIENKRCGFREARHHDWLKALADYLQVDIPYVIQKPPKKSVPAIRTPEAVEPLKEKTAVDIELIVINACGKHLLKLSTPNARRRVLSYLHERYVTGDNHDTD